MDVVRIIKKFRLILNSQQKKRILGLGILMIIGGILEMFSVSLILPFMNAVMNTDGIMEKWYVKLFCDIFQIHSSRSFLVIAGFLLAFIYIAKNLYLIIEYNIQYKFVYENMFTMQRQLLQQLIHKPYEYFLHVNSGEIIRIINVDTSNAFNILMILLSFFSEFIVSLLLIVAIFIITPSMTILIAIVLIMLLAVIYLFIKPPLRRAGIENQQAGAGMNKWLLQSIQGIKELKVLQKERFFEDNYNEYGQRYIHSQRIFKTLSLAPRYCIEGVGLGTIFIVISLMIYSGIELATLVPVLTAVAMAAIRLLPSVNKISSALSQIAYGEPMLDKVIENLSVFENYSDMGNDVLNKGSIQKFEEKIEINTITYRYPETETDVLEEVSMVISKGEAIGVVGTSGAGKTTAVDVILGLLVPASGGVFVDGQDIKADISGWLNQIGYIPQSIFMLDDTIRANVAFGFDKDEIDEDDVWRALSEASLDIFVRSLPDGLDTEIGEGGVRLSGGQRQRIGIARALYHNPEILVFDEATSALDNETETAIMESINGLYGSKTMIIIAHRLTTIEGCDHVYRVENKKIVKER